MMLNFGRFFVDVQPEKLTIKQGTSAKTAVATKWGIPDTTVEKLADLLS